MARLFLNRDHVEHSYGDLTTRPRSNKGEIEIDREADT